jgi:predicted peptidase
METGRQRLLAPCHNLPMTRRDALFLAGALPMGAAGQSGSEPKLAPGAPDSAERMALIEAFEKKTAGLAQRFEARTHKPIDGWAIPYRLFRPEAAGRLPLVLYLHGAGGIGSDNRKQIEGGNLFGTHLWALPETQRQHPCYIVAPQTDRRWLRYDAARPPGQAHLVSGFGQGAAAAVDVVDALRREFAIDERRIYVTGNSMGGGGTWHMVAHRATLFAAAVPCCGGPAAESGSENPGVPVWNFHGDADKSVPVEVSRERIAARRKAGGEPVYTEYSGVGHNVARWAYTEPGLPEWLFAQRR